jgi:hypothetical protein
MVELVERDMKNALQHAKEILMLLFQYFKIRASRSKADEKICAG